MTQREWLTSEEMQSLLVFVRSQTSGRKFRLPMVSGSKLAGSSTLHLSRGMLGLDSFAMLVTGLSMLLSVSLWHWPDRPL
jgi:hypothetical protein